MVYYVGGPVSVLNAACGFHANIRIDYYNHLALTMKPLTNIAAGDELYIQYDSRPLEQMGTLSECPKCRRLVTDI